MILYIGLINQSYTGDFKLITNNHKNNYFDVMLNIIQRGYLVKFQK